MLVTRSANGSLNREELTITVPFKRSIEAYGIGVWADWLPVRSSTPIEYLMTMQTDDEGSSSNHYMTSTGNEGTGFLGDL